jgi:hypothetical protein
MTAITLIPASPTTDAVVSASLSSSDPDGDAVTYGYQWRKNGSAIAGATGATLDLAQAGHGDKGDAISLTVTPNDGTVDGGASTSGAATVANSAPVVSSVSITPPSPTTDQTLTATPTGTDPDGDTVTYAYQWRRNGTAIAGATGSTLDLSQSGNGDRGDAITVDVTPSDGAATGSAFTAGRAASTVTSGRAGAAGAALGARQGARGS